MGGNRENEALAGPGRRIHARTLAELGCRSTLLHANRGDRFSHYEWMGVRERQSHHKVPVLAEDDPGVLVESTDLIEEFRGHYEG